MRRAAIILGLFLGALATASSASAATVTVCASGCTSTTIQGGIAAAAPGDTVAIAAGRYVENVIVDRPVTLQGAGHGATVVRPAVSNPVCTGGSLCGGAASSIVLVQASDVTITGLTLDGDNPALTSGVVAGGADLDARNGIITNHRAGVYTNLSVTNVTVKNVYLRGIYASSGGSFAFDHDTVTNVQAEYASIAIFNFGGSGVVSNSTVSAANDAISSNWSTGTRYVGNTVTGSTSGIHTDNNGGSGDVIEGNTVTSCSANGYGIWVFVPDSSPTVRSNRVNGCSVGLAAFGGRGGVTLFSGNRVNGSNTDGSDSTGVLVTTDQLGYGAGDVSATFTGNTVKHFETGVSVDQSGGGTARVAFHYGAIAGNTVGAFGGPGTTVDAQNDWWGCKAGPNQPGCDTATGTVAYTPWLTSPSAVKA